MKGFLIFIFGAVLGALASFVLSSGLALGVGAGVGIATGLKAGACLAVEAAREEGLISDEQVDDVFAGIGRQLDSQGAADIEKPVGTEAECREVIAKMRATASN
jgi:hypothetical protein